MKHLNMQFISKERLGIMYYRRVTYVVNVSITVLLLLHANLNPLKQCEILGLLF